MSHSWLLCATGLIPLCYAYLDYIGCERETQRRVGTYLEFIRKRATGP